MKVCICKKSSTKTGKSYVVLTINDVYVSFDVMTICKVADISPKVIDSMSVGDVISLDCK